MAETMGFMIYHDDAALIDRLSDADLARIIRAAIHFAADGEEPNLDPLMAMAFAPIKEKISRDAEKYMKKREAGAKGGSTSKAEPKQTEANGKQTEAEAKHTEAECKQTGVTSNKYIVTSNEYPVTSNEYTILSDCVDGGEAANAHACARETHEALDTDDVSVATGTENVQVAVQKPKVKAIRHKYGEYQNVLLTDEDYEKLQAEFPTEYEALIERLSAYMASTGRAYKNHLATMRNWARRDLEKGTARSSPIPQAREAPPVYRQQTKAEELDDFYHMAAEWAAEASGGNDE